MNETLEANSPDGEVREETYTWVIWKDHPAGVGQVNRHIMELVGSLEAESQWSPWTWKSEDMALAHICRLGDGADDYLLICEDRVQRVSIVAETVYRRADQ